jgi:BolA protein
MLEQKFNPIELVLENESHTHNVPKGSETHFKLQMTAQAFEGLSRVARQQLVLSELKAEFESGLHALTMRLRAPSDKPEGSHFTSPVCLGGEPKKS